jgi:hypothetical protein
VDDRRLAGPRRVLGPAVLFWLDRWDRGEQPRRLEDADIDWINDAGKPLCLALPPRVAADLTVAIASEVDRRLAALPDGRIAATGPRATRFSSSGRTTARRTSTRSSARFSNAATGRSARRRPWARARPAAASGSAVD